MDIDAAQRRKLPDGTGEKLPEGHHHDDLGAIARRVSTSHRIVESLGLGEGQPMPSGRQLHRRRAQVSAAAGRAIGLGRNQADGVAIGHQSVEARGPRNPGFP